MDDETKLNKDRIERNLRLAMSIPEEVPKLTPSYYAMNETQDVFAWMDMLPDISIGTLSLCSIYGTWTTGFRYARRCLWKGTTPQAMALDARKAAATFIRLAELLEG